MTKKFLQILIYLSCVLIVIGVFLPLASIPIYGDITYNRIASFESYIVIVCAVCAPLLVLVGKQKITVISAVAIWVTLLFPAIKKTLQGSEEQGLLGDLISSATDPLKDFAADLILNVTDFSWGGYVFLGGIVILTISSVLSIFKSK